MPASVRCPTLQPCPGFSGDGRCVSSCGGHQFAPAPVSARTPMRQILTSFAVAALIVLTASSAVAQSQPDPGKKDVPATPAPRRQPPTRQSSPRTPSPTSAASGASARPSTVAMPAQRDITASLGSTGVAGAMCGSIALTIAMDIATMSTSGGSSAAILQAPATAVAHAGRIGSITVGICERWDRPTEPRPIVDTIRKRHRLSALRLQAGKPHGGPD